MTLDKMLWLVALGRGWGTSVAESITTQDPCESYLPNVDGRVQTAANIHDDVCAKVLRWTGK